MAKVTIDDVLESIDSWTMLEVNKLVKGIENKYGISAAAPVAVAARPGGGRRRGGGGEDGIQRHPGRCRREEDPSDQGGSRHHGAGPERSQRPGGRRSQAGQGRISKAEADEIKKKLEDAGATVELK